MKFCMYADEMYPWYVEDDKSNAMEVPDEIVKRWREVHKAYMEVQEEMQRYYRDMQNRKERAGPICANGPMAKEVPKQILDELITPNAG